MKRFTVGIVAGFVAALVVAPASAAGMAPTYVSSEPSDGEELHRAPDRVEVTFSEPLDESSELSVTDSCGRTVDDGRASVDGNTVSIGIALKPSGHYQVDYRATGIAGLTGTTTGGFHFMVHFGKDCDGGSGGGHEGHGGKKNGGGGGGHDEHDGSGGDQHESGGGHDESGSGEHTGSGHTSSTGGNAHTGAHTDGSGGDEGHGAHGKRNKGNGHKGKHRDHRTTKGPASDEGSAGRTLAAGDGQPLAPDGRAVTLALGFSLALGSVGGWFLRVSAAR